MPNRLALVTGTSSGIGEEVAHQLLERGWNVGGIARRAVAMNSSAYDHFTIDLADVERLTSNLESHGGPRLRDGGLNRLALVNNAADVALLGQVDQLEAAGMLQAYAINTVAPVLLMGWVLRTTLPRTPVRIVNVSSGAGVEPFPGLGAYGSTKAALRLAGMVLGAELDMLAAAGAPRDATVNSTFAWPPLEKRLEPGRHRDPDRAWGAGRDVVIVVRCGVVPLVEEVFQIHLDPDVPAHSVVSSRVKAGKAWQGHYIAYGGIHLVLVDHSQAKTQFPDHLIAVPHRDDIPRH